MKLIPGDSFEKRHSSFLYQKIEEPRADVVAEKMNELQEKIPSNITPPSALPPSQGISKDHKAEKSEHTVKENVLKKTFSRILGHTKRSASAPHLKIKNEDFINPRSRTQSLHTFHELRAKQKYTETPTVETLFEKVKQSQDDALSYLETLIKHSKESKSENKMIKDVLNGLTEMAKDADDSNANLLAARILGVLIKNSTSKTLKILNSLLESESKEKTLGAIKNIILSIKNQEQFIGMSSKHSAINDQIDEICSYVINTDENPKKFNIQSLKKIDEKGLLDTNKLKQPIALFLKDIPEVEDNIERVSDTIKFFKEVIKHFETRETSKDFESFIFIYKQLSKQIATFEGTINIIEPLLRARLAKQLIVNDLRLRIHEMKQGDPTIREDKVKNDSAIKQFLQDLKSAEKDLYNLEIDRQKAAFSALEPYKLKSNIFKEVKPSFLPEEEVQKVFDKLLSEEFPVSA